MSSDAGEEVGRWRQATPPETGPTRTGTRKWTTAALVGTLLALFAVGALYIVLSLFVWTGPRPYFVPIWVSTYQRTRELPPLPWGEADRAATLDSGLFPNSPRDASAEPTLEVIRERLETLEARRGDDSLVVYVSSYAVVDADGHVRILAADSHPSPPPSETGQATEGTFLPLADLLARLKATPARHKLLVLDLAHAVPTPRDPGLLWTTDGVADVIPVELEESGDPGLLVLTASSPGEVGLGSESLGHSVFNAFFREALRDPAADANQDGRVTVMELAGYVAGKTDQWAQQYRGVHQRPALLGSADDFALTVVKPRASSEAPTSPTTATSKAAAPPAAAKAAQSAVRVPPAPVPVPPAAAKVAAAAAKGAAVPAPSGSAAATPGAATASNPDSDAPEATPDETYPSWLETAWVQRQALISGGALTITPRAVRTIDDALGRAEREWREGRTPRLVRSDLERSLRRAGEAFEQARTRPHPPFRSALHARAFGQAPAATLAAPLRTLLRKVREHDPDATPENLQAARKEAVKPFLEALKGKTSLELAAAIVAVAAAEPLTPEAWIFLDRLIDQAAQAEPGMHRDVLELRVVHQLAERAASADPVSAALLGAAWDVSCTSEELAATPEAWVLCPAELQRAEDLGHKAEVLLRPEARGMAPSEAIAEAWEDARAAYDVVRTRIDGIRHSRETLAQALYTLSATLPYLDSQGRGDYESLWLETAQVAEQLEPLLESAEQASPAPSSHVQSGESTSPAGLLADATARLDAHLDTLRRPFQPDRTRALIEACSSDRPDPGLLVRLDALLSTPLVTAEARSGLWEARQVAEARLGELPAPAVLESKASPSDLRATARRVVRQRSHVLGSLVRLAEGSRSTAPSAVSPPPATGDDDATVDSVGASSPIWAELARRAVESHARLASLAEAASKAATIDWVGLLVPTPEATLISRAQVDRQDQRARATWTRMGSRLLHRRDDPGDRDPFLETAALESFQIGGQALPDRLEIGIALPSDGLGLSADRTEQTVPLSLTWRPADLTPTGSRNVEVAVLDPHDPRLSVEWIPTARVELQPGTPAALTLRVRWKEPDESAATSPRRTAPTGLVVRATPEGGRTFHRLIPLAITPESERLRLALSRDPSRPDSTPFDLALRTLPGRQPFYLFVSNPTSVTRPVIVRLVNSGIDSPGEGRVVAEVKHEAMAGKATRVGPFAETPRKPEEPLAPWSDGLKIQIVDAESGQVLESQTVRVSIAGALELVRVVRAEFLPSHDGRPNRLAVTLRSLPGLAEPAALVNLDVPLDRALFPALLAPPKGRLSGSLEPGGELALYAEALVLDPAAARDGVFALDIDGQKRALAFRAPFPLQGGPRRAVLDTKPSIRLSATPEVKPDQPARLVVDFAVDNAPPQARLECRLGQFDGPTLIDDISPWTAPAKRAAIGFDHRGEAGALLFEASVSDWTHAFEVAGIRGRRWLVARLVDPAGLPIGDPARLALVLDDLPPRDLVFGPLPTEVPKGTGSLRVSAVVTLPASSVNEVTFFVGPPGDFEKAVAGGLATKGRPVASDPTRWEGTLALPPTLTDPLVLGVRVVSGVELAGFARPVELRVVDARPTAEALKAKKEAELSKPGIIQGKVTQGNLPQPNLTVTAVDLKPKADPDAKPSEVKTGKDGTFVFKELKPGKYRVSVSNVVSRTRAEKEVTIEPGKTQKLELDLFR